MNYTRVQLQNRQSVWGRGNPRDYVEILNRQEERRSAMFMEFLRHGLEVQQLNDALAPAPDEDLVKGAWSAVDGFIHGQLRNVSQHSSLLWSGNLHSQKLGCPLRRCSVSSPTATRRSHH